MKKILIFILWFSFGLAAVTYYFLFTEAGLEFLARKALLRYLKADEVQMSGISGNVFSGVKIHYAELKNPEWFPPGSRWRIQELFFDVNAPTWKGIVLRVRTAQLNLPRGSAPILVSGMYQDGKMNFNIFSASVDIDEVAGLFHGINLHNLTGSVAEVDIYVEGPYRKPKVYGELLIEKLARDVVRVENIPVSFNFELQNIFSDEPLIHGQMTHYSGTVHTPRTDIQLEESSFRFSGEWDNPALNLRGISVIEKIKISVRIEGTLRNPEIIASSSPPLPSDHLLLMLATGQRWKGLESSLAEAKVNPGFIKDLVNYFLLAGSGEGVASKLGISDIYLRVEDDQRAIGLKKDISEKMRVGYGVEETIGQDESSRTTQKLQGEYLLTDKISIELEKSLNRSTSNAESPLQQDAIDTEPPEDKIWLKFKTSF